MSKLNILVHLNAYSDPQSSNNPNLNNLKWSREILGMVVNDPRSEGMRLGAGSSRSVFNGSRTLSHDGTTIYSLSIKPGTSNTYVLKATGGTLPAFRTLRALGSDATTQVSVTKNANLVTVTVTGGTAPDFLVAGVVPGDQMILGPAFATQNRGKHTILSATANSVSFESVGAVPEASVTLGAGFADELRIFSAAGVQEGDTVAIQGDFSALSQGAYEVTFVSDYYLEFYSTATLPTETKTTDAIAVYTDAKQLIYIETNKKLDVTINGSQTLRVEPMVQQNVVTPGMLLLKASVYSLSIANADTAEASVFVASVE